MLSSYYIKSICIGSYSKIINEIAYNFLRYHYTFIGRLSAIIFALIFILANMQPVSHKKKFTTDEYVSLNRANPIIKTYTSVESSLVCICGQKDNNIGF